MIIYQATKREFVHQVRQMRIEDVILDNHKSIAGHSVGPAQIRAWAQSLQHVGHVLDDDEIPDEAGVAVEYKVPQTNKSIDVLVTGFDAKGRPRVVIIELKQWSSSRLSDKTGLIWAHRGGRTGESEGTHPCYQAWSYAGLLRDFNEAVHEGGIEPHPCAYLHNYLSDGVIDHPRYLEQINLAPLFLREDQDKLKAFIRLHVKRGDHLKVLYQIENGRIKPSRMLADSVRSLIQGKPEFILVDDQKVVYETALQAIEKAAGGRKQVVIVQGGPGTGKSVVAINLVATCTGRQMNARYVSKNAAPREVYQAKLAGRSNARYRNLFSGSGAFTQTEANTFDVLVADEAHRLNEKGGLYGNQGDHQVKEIIRAARCTVFFVDDDQRVTLADIGQSSDLRRWAHELDAEVTDLELASQFRCSGSDSYLAWLDNTLEIRETANSMLSPVQDHDFRVLDTPGELHELINSKNKAANKARVVAGYCWPWKSKTDPNAWDIDIREHGYRRRWNLTEDGSLWIMADASVEQVGCIHTCQGLEVDYVGVIIGPDLVYRDGRIETDTSKRARADKTIKGLGKIKKADPGRAAALAESIVKNTYRTLMTRGLKGCFVYCVDPALRDHLRSRLEKSEPAAAQAPAIAISNVVPIGAVRSDKRQKDVAYVPLVELRIAAGGFGSPTALDESATAWMPLPDFIPPRPGLFVARVHGESMNRLIRNGAWCLFRANPEGTRQGKAVVVQHRSIEDPETGGSYTIKRYFSEKAADSDGSWHHTRIVLRPDSDEPRFKDIVIDGVEDGEFQVVAEFLTVLDQS